MKKLLSLLLLSCLLLLCGCGAEVSAPAEPAETAAASAADPAETVIVLAGDHAEIRGGGASAEGSTVTISTVGSYRLSGTLEAGQIIVDTGEDAVNVTLILDGADIANADGPALCVRQAKNLYLQLADGSVNSLRSGVEADLASYDETRSGAALFAEDDLIIEGGGSLSIYGYRNNGVTCKDDLEIRGGTLTVTAANNGVRASESLVVSGGEISVSAGNDGLKTSSAKKAGKGYVEISGGTISITAQDDGIQAATDLRITGGSVSIDARKEPVKAAGVTDIQIELDLAEK